MNPFFKGKNWDISICWREECFFSGYICLYVMVVMRIMLLIVVVIFVIIVCAGMHLNII